MRILALSHAAVVDVNQEPFHELARAGADVTLVVPKALDTDIRGRVELAELPGFAGELVGLDVAIGGFRKVLGGQRGIHLIVYHGLGEAVERARPDLVFVEEEPYSAAALQAARAAGKVRAPFVVHENQNIVRVLPPPFEAMRKAVLARAGGVTVRSKSAEFLVRALGFGGPIGPFPHGVDPSRYESAAIVDLPAPVIGFVGRLVPEKGLIDLIVAIEQAGTGSLLVVGDGPQLEAARERAHAIPSVFTGAIPHEDVPAWYGAMDVVVVPSRTTETWMEQFGRIVIEANAAGKPVVVTSSGELPHTVQATGGGLVVPEGDVGALADAIAALTRDAGLRERLGAAGRAAVAERFTPRAIARELLGFLEGIAR
ncbi:MAG TPA: glycosyltransferase family 4 protein [Actinomycetota bacterium]